MKNLRDHTFKAIFFDWDNTLVDTWPIIFKASNAALKHFGLPEATLEEIKIRAQLSTREGFPKLFGEQWEEARGIFYQTIFENKDDVRLYEGTHSSLQALKKSGYLIAIISNKKCELLREEVKRLNIPYDFILGSGDSPQDKPHPDMGLMTLKHFGLQPHEAVYIGDSITDWMFAQNLNMAAIAIGNDAYDGPLLARFNTVNELVKKLLEYPAT
jgi:phosphoglycolate phosphatase